MRNCQTYVLSIVEVLLGKVANNVLIVELFPGHRVPQYTIYIRLHQRFRESGTCNKADC